MKFGPIPVAQAKGAILAHSLNVNGLRLRKGRTLNTADIAALLNACITEVTAATLEVGDITEDQAAQALAKSLVPDPSAASLRISAPFTGRVNIYAETGGVVQIDAAAIDRFNAVSPTITVATVPDMTRAYARALIATVKVIPYAVRQKHIDEMPASAALRLAPFRLKTASLILTQTPGMPEKLLSKGREAVARRMQALNCTLGDVITVPHETTPLAEAISNATGDIILILTGSATSDIADVGPAALTRSGGKITRFGMPVDPGNLLFLGAHNGRPVVGLPGCARSPALNGADWVLERLVCGLDVTDKDIAGMGVGGLLKEIPTRPQPRGGSADAPTQPKVEVLLLAAGGSRRMRGKDKLLEIVDGEPLLRRTARAALKGREERVHVVMQPENANRDAALEGLNVNQIPSPEWVEGMAASIRAGMAGLSQDCDAVIIALADMPDVSAMHFDRLAAAYDTTEAREICRALAADGTPGLPVLFGRRFFETLANLQGDRGARDVVKDAPEFLVDVPTDGQGAIIDLDTPEAWRTWRADRRR
ncbi:MAG: 4-diphosphocytidyl-2C-methyl-D-erythritol kinase [Rhodobacteraceae bacterium]|nr:MAG: 4-diphosphocytidyl-2C-methyl-D-erythritol kinase [Paracoccaceae bacterium]